MNNQINEILREHSDDPVKATQEIKKITKKNFTLYNEEGSLFVEFEELSDNISFDGSILLEE